MSTRNKFQILDRQRAVADLVRVCARLSSDPSNGEVFKEVATEFTRLLAVENLERKGLRNGETTIVGTQSAAAQLHLRAERLVMTDDEDFVAELSIFESYLQHFERYRT